MTKKSAITPLQLSVLRAFHSDPQAKACDIAESLAAPTWSVHEAVGSLWVDGLVTVDGGHHLTREGAAAIGVEYTPHVAAPAASTPAKGQLGLFGGPL